MCIINKLVKKIYYKTDSGKILGKEELPASPFKHSTRKNAHREKENLQNDTEIFFQHAPFFVWGRRHWI